MPSLTIEDGTPVSDVLEEMRELKAQVQRMKKAFRAVTNVCNAPYWKSTRRWDIERIARDALNDKFDGIHPRVKI